MKHVKKQMIEAIFITSLVIANVVTGKVLQLGPFIVPGAFLLYAFTFLCTDLMSELYGKAEAIKMVKVGFIASLFSASMIFLTQYLPAAGFSADKQIAYETLLGTNFRFVIASMIAYYVSQTWDVWFFHKVKERTGAGKKWMRNNFSTMTSQLFDTGIFISIAFIGVVPNIWIMILSQYVLKMVIAALDTPIFYLLTRETKVRK